MSLSSRQGENARIQRCSVIDDDCSIFLTNAKGFPVLSRAHQAFLKSLFKVLSLHVFSFLHQLHVMAVQGAGCAGRGRWQPGRRAVRSVRACVIRTVVDEFKRDSTGRNIATQPITMAGTSSICTLHARRWMPSRNLHRDTKTFCKTHCRCMQ